MHSAIIDACALINLVNSGGAAEVLAACGVEVWFQGLVEDEIVEGAQQLEGLVDQGLLRRYDGSTLAAVSVGSIATGHDLGIGEAECIAICLDSGLSLISDDRRARNVGSALLGSDDVIGTIGLLCMAIDCDALTVMEAAALLAQAKKAGGFLPDFDFETREMVA